MEWTEALRRSISFMEDHLLDTIDPYDVADAVNISPYYFQKGFKLLTGYSVSEYIRNRRLYFAALDMAGGTCKVIDAAFTYGYDTPESFTKAFTRFHGVSPIQIRGNVRKIKPFLPLTITLSIQGGSEMDYRIEKKDTFKVIGYERLFSFDEGYEKIPLFWNEFIKMRTGKQGAEKQVLDIINHCKIGEFAVCIDDVKGQKKFRYLIAGIYDGGPVAEGMSICEIPAAQWAQFRCTGPLPGALQTINTEIFKNWLPGNPDYEMADNLTIEWYSEGTGKDPNYESAIWIPVKSKLS